MIDEKKEGEKRVKVKLIFKALEIGELADEIIERNREPKEKEGELKTLDDFYSMGTPSFLEGCWVNKKDLKEEAIKWIKEDTLGYPDIYSTLDGLKSVTRFIKFFFNISKKDLLE